MRVLFTTTGNAGHLLPLVPIARACVRAGHEVCIATQRSRRDDVRALGLPAHAFDDPRPDAWGAIMASATGLSVDEINARVVGELFAHVDTVAALPGVLDVVEAWRPDVIVRETYEFAGALVGELHDVPHVRVGLGLAGTEQWAIDLARPALRDIRRELGLPNDPRSDRMGRSLYLTPVPSLLEDPTAPGPPSAVRFRVPRPATLEPLPDWWPGDDRPLVYLTFGSMAGGLGHFPELYRSSIEALAAVPARVLVTTGNDADPNDLGSLPAGVHVERWVPQEAVMETAAAVVCHGGFGTTLAALAAGVPTVVLPLFASDQWQLARRVGEIGAGTALPEYPEPGRRAFDPPGTDAMQSLPGAVRHLLEHPAPSAAAHAIRDAIARLPSVDAVVGSLERTADRSRSVR